MSAIVEETMMKLKLLRSLAGHPLVPLHFSSQSCFRLDLRSPLMLPFRVRLLASRCRAKGAAAQGRRGAAPLRRSGGGAREEELREERHRVQHRLGLSRRSEEVSLSSSLSFLLFFSRGFPKSVGGIYASVGRSSG